MTSVLQENVSQRLRPPAATLFLVAAHHVNSMLFARLHPGDLSFFVSRHVMVALGLQLPFVVVRRQQCGQRQPHTHYPVSYLSSGLRCHAANDCKPTADAANDAKAELPRSGISKPTTA